MRALEDDFHHEMMCVVDFANAHRFGQRFRNMISQYGAVQAAKLLLATSEVQEGLMRLWEEQALDKSMEAQVIRTKFKSLFTQAEIDEARRRLTELNYFKDYKDTDKGCTK